MPGQGSTYLDQLALLNEQNFLGGAAVYGKAIKEKKQNETLVDLYNKFKADKNELQTTMEQTGDFNKYLGSIDVKSEVEGEVPKDVMAAVDFMKNVDQMGAYTNLYQPFITAFATLGDDGVKIATTLSNELATQLELAEKKSEVPWKVLQYNSMMLQHRFTREKYADYLSDKESLKQTNDVTDWILTNSESFDSIDGGKVISNDPQKLTKYNTFYNATLDELKKTFPDVKEGVLSSAIDLAMQRAGKSFTFNEDIYDMMKLKALQSKDYKGFLPQDIQTYSSFLRGWSDKWRSMDKAYKVNLQSYMKGSYTPADENERRVLESDASIYNQNGLFQQYHDALSGVDPAFMQTKREKMGKPGEEIDVETPMDAQILKLMGVNDTKDIIRMLTSNTFQDGSYKYNPETFYRQKADVDGQIPSGSMIPGESGVSAWELVSTTFDYLMLPKTGQQREDIKRAVEEMDLKDIPADKLEQMSDAEIQKLWKQIYK